MSRLDIIGTPAQAKETIALGTQGLGQRPINLNDEIATAKEHEARVPVLISEIEAHVELQTTAQQR